MKPSEILRGLDRPDIRTLALEALSGAPTGSLTLTDLRAACRALGSPRRSQALTAALDDLATEGMVRAWRDTSRPGRPSLRLAIVTPVT